MRWWLVWSNEHNGWWAPGWNGYVKDIHQAGRYSQEEAIEICHKANFFLRKDLLKNPEPRAPNETMLPAPEKVGETP
jgi:hypothetical protein